MTNMIQVSHLRHIIITDMAAIDGIWSFTIGVGITLEDTLLMVSGVLLWVWLVLSLEYQRVVFLIMGLFEVFTLHNQFS